MAHSHILLGAGDIPARPSIRRIGFADLKDALADGVDDFMAMPTHAMFLCAIYPIIGLVLARLAFGYSILPLLYPLASGFVLVGPLAALGLYELSRRREAGLPGEATHAFDVLRSSSIGAIVALGLLLLLIVGVWLAVADAIYVADFGYAPPASFASFVHDVLTTPAGLESHHRRQWRRLLLCRRRADHRRGVVPAAARPRRRRRGRAAHLDPRGCGKSAGRWRPGA